MGRTLEFSGTKRVEALVQRANATKHSMTLFPFISAAGGILNPLAVIFYEPNQPKSFQQQLERFGNLSPTGTKSGKMTAELTLEYFNHLKKFFSPFNEKILVLLDAWSGYNSSISCPNLEQSFEFVVLPKKTTPLLQPLDVYYNRQLKHFLKLLSNYVRRKAPDFIISTRANIGLIISLVHDQFCAPKYKNMIKYAFYASGYYKVHPGEFVTPAKYCFIDKPPNAPCYDCQQISFIRCSHCENNFCFEHFVIAYHHHFNEYM